jgi:hypothetical protein
MCHLPAQRRYFSYAWCCMPGAVHFAVECSQALHLDEPLAKSEQIRPSSTAQTGHDDTYSNILLGCSSTRYHDGSGVLNLHFMQQHMAVFCEFNLACAIHEHFQGTTGSCSSRYMHQRVQSTKHHLGAQGMWLCTVPKLVFMTSCKPLPAFTLMSSAAARLTLSACGFTR